MKIIKLDKPEIKILRPYEYEIINGKIVPNASANHSKK